MICACWRQRVTRRTGTGRFRAGSRWGALSLRKKVEEASAQFQEAVYPRLHHKAEA